MGPYANRTGVLTRRGRGPRDALTQRKDHVRKQLERQGPPTSHGEKPQEKPNLPAL